MYIIINLMLWSVLGSYASSSSWDKLVQAGLTQKTDPHLGICTPATHTYGSFDTTTDDTARYTIISTLRARILPQRPAEAAQALATVTATSAEEFGIKSLQVLQELQKDKFTINPTTCSVVQFLLSGSQIHIRSSTFKISGDGCLYVYSVPHEISLVHTGHSVLTFSDAREITTQATPLAVSADAHAQATCGDNPLRIVVDLEAWQNRPKGTSSHERNERRKNKSFFLGCLLSLGTP